MPTTSETLLRVKGLSVRFGGIVALDGISFDVERGQICGSAIFAGFLILCMFVMPQGFVGLLRAAR